MSDPEPSDEDLIAETAQGDNRAYAELWRRHSGAAYSVARSYRTLDADDLVAESFAKVLRAILNGGGPEISFRAYLFTTIRNTAATQLKQVTALSIDRDFDPDTFSELSVEGPEVTGDSVAARAFRRIPQRWQQVLWYVGVEGLSPVEAAPYLSLSPNGVSALAMRARKAFRREMVLVAVADLPADSRCRPALLSKVAASTDEGPTTAAHLSEHSTDTCNQCRAILGDGGVGRLSLSVLVLIGALGAESVPGLVTPLEVTASALGFPAGTESASFGFAPTSTPITLISAPSTLGPAKLVAVTTMIAAASVAVAGMAFGGAPPTAEQPTSSDVRDDDPPDSLIPIVEPTPSATAEPPSDARPAPVVPSPVAPAPEPPNSEQEAPGLGNGAAPQFTLVVESAETVAEIRGLGTPGWTVEAFVADGLNGFALAQTREGGDAPRATACPRPPKADIARAYSTGLLDSAVWSLALSDLEPGDYAVVVVECTVQANELVSSVFSTPRSFTVEPRP